MNIEKNETIPLWSQELLNLDETAYPEESLDVRDIKVVRNVSIPTLTTYLPDPSIADGTAVVVCPGGGYHFLSIDMEGIDVARWLNARGIAAFVLKYRVIQTGDDFPEVVWRRLANEQSMTDIMEPLWPKLLADGQQAIRIVRERAPMWNIKPDRIGMMGFSAGSTVTINVALEHDALSRPDFVAAIYSAGRANAPVPDDAPPLFILSANDDEMAAPISVDLYTTWRGANKPVELHIIAKGGHGFGMRKLGMPTDSWIESLYSWLSNLVFE